MIVVSSYSQKENVFRALELGAVDFVAKPDRSVRAAPETEEALDGLLFKVLSFLERARWHQRAAERLPPPPIAHARVSITGRERGARTRAARRRRDRRVDRRPLRVEPRCVRAARRTRGAYAVVVAQHMPERFTRTFAERLDKKSALKVAEAVDGDLVVAQSAFVCPGRQCMEVELVPGGRAADPGRSAGP